MPEPTYALGLAAVIMTMHMPFGTLLTKIQNAVDPATIHTLLGLMLLFAIMDFGPAVRAGIDKRFGVNALKNINTVIGCGAGFILLAHWWLSR